MRGSEQLRAIGIIGRKGSGKTHLIERLIGELTRRGARVSTIKHTHHHSPEIDAPGKDSFRHRSAGANEVIVAADTGYTLVRHRAGAASLHDLLGALAPVDWVLVEGFKSMANLPRIEVYRPAATRDAPLASDDASIAAIATPRGGTLPALVCPRLDLDDTGAIADFIDRLTTQPEGARYVRLAS